LPLHPAGEDPGVQTAPHVPAVIEPVTHCPTLLQVCGVASLAPTHWLDCGVQTAPHMPAVIEPVTHCPRLLQVCGVASPAPMHCVEFGAHIPAHEPPEQRYGQGDPETHCPEAPQDCGVVPVHCVCCGEQVPSQEATPPFKAHVELLHCVAFPQEPAAVHACVPLAMHWV
jgi:hypothetical protein